MSWSYYNVRAYSEWSNFSGSSFPDRDGAYSVRSVPVRMYLPDGPVMQELVPPLLEDGKQYQFSAGYM
jgi:hypothetical protein